MRHVTRQVLCFSMTLGLVLGSTACEPASVADARGQLGRNGERVLEYTVPIADSTFQLQTLFDAGGIVLDTTPEGVLAIRSEPESLAVAVGESLQFADVNTDSLVVSFDPALFAAPPGTRVPFEASYDAPAVGLRFPSIDTTDIHGGVLVLTSESRLTADVSYEITLYGVIDQSGAPLRQSGVIAPAPGDGSYESSDVVFDLAGVTILPGAIEVSVTGEATLRSPMDPAFADSAIIQAGRGDLTIDRLVGRPDPGAVGELAIAVQEMTEVPPSSLDFNDFEDAVRDSRINNATLRLLIDNDADLPATSSDLTIGLVQLDPFGSVPRGASGEILYEVDSTGTPILVPVTDSGSTEFSLPRSSSSSLELPSATLVNRLIDLLLDDARVAFIAAGTVRLGDGNWGSISRTDRVALRVDVLVMMDLTIPESGVAFTRSMVQDGLLRLSETSVNDVTDRVSSAMVITDVVNQTPFGVEVEIAFVSGELAENVDVFAEPDRVLLSGLTVAAPTVDAGGRVVEPTSAAVEIALDGTDLRPLLNERFTAGMRARLVPGSGANGRGVVGATDRIFLNSRARVQLRAGGS